MYLTPEITRNIFADNSPRQDAKDSGSPQSQVALLTYRISHLTEHLKKHPKDKSTQFGLLKLVGQRKRMLSYLKNTDIEAYRALLKKLSLRR